MFSVKRVVRFLTSVQCYATSLFSRLLRKEFPQTQGDHDKIRLGSRNQMFYGSRYFTPLRDHVPVRRLWLFAIYTGKPVGLRFGQMVSKFPQYWEIPFGTGAYHLQKSLLFTKQFAQRLRLTKTSQNKGFD